LTSIIFTCGSRALAAKDAVMAADRAFARVVREVAAPGAGVQREDGVGRERAEAHRRDVEEARAVRLGAAGADDDAKVVRRQHGRLQRVVDPLVADGRDVHLRAERALVGIVLGALVDERSLLARERRRLVVALDEVLADLRPDELEQEPEVADHRIVAQDRVPVLHDVAQADEHEAEEDDREPEVHAHRRPRDEARGQADEAQGPGRIANGEERVEPGDPTEHALSCLGVARW